MLGKWIDIIIIVLVAISTFRGFRRGLIREVFSLLGSIIAIVVAYQGYQELSLHLMMAYPLTDWQAQLIAFLVLVLAISLTAVLLGFIWAKIIRLTPFAILDNLAGAGFGMLKSRRTSALLCCIVNILRDSSINQVLQESIAVQYIYSFWPQMNKQLEVIWPKDWPKPAWLFPDFDSEKTYNFFMQTPAILAGFLINGKCG